MKRDAIEDILAVVAFLVLTCLPIVAFIWLFQWMGA